MSFRARERRGKTKEAMCPFEGERWNDCKAPGSAGWAKGTQFVKRISYGGRGKL